MNKKLLNYLNLRIKVSLKQSKKRAKAQRKLREGDKLTGIKYNESIRTVKNANPER